MNNGHKHIAGPESSEMSEPEALLRQISQLIQQARQQLQRSVNTTVVQTYWQIGRLIIEDEQQGENRAAYGKALLENLSQRLTQQFGKGFDITNLRNMRRFYEQFPIRETLSPELSWSHYNLLARLENPAARQWYMDESAQQNWSVRALERQIGTLYYERLLSSKEHAPVRLEASANTAPLAEQPQDYLRDPYILDFLNLDDRSYQEKDLESGIISNLQHFLLELGKGFAFVERQQRIRTEDQDFYIDLVFYNYKLKCFLLIDLKIGKLTHQDVGQMDSYVRIYDQHKKEADDNPTIGLVLCSQKSEAVVKYSVLADSKQLFASRYMAYLPSEAQLQQELQRERQAIEARLATLESRTGSFK
ncbi:PDDEXK nuclease domain-containing protein [Iodobacter sp. CM08]|uniref:PDDEXK nuclease domain-containing protein n=1 Tax=Iodobacter sp. CM08 TaxID=3085902 RepID=UPI002980B0CE|nr:PDDEXK nuclease domain-containing protein [Iodobacter sp. CM08]MDW5418664.1 PDDEXK nuclease domain-containing protein [Iodobacter sp. CM08]